MPLRAAAAADGARPLCQSRLLAASLASVRGASTSNPLPDGTPSLPLSICGQQMLRQRLQALGAVVERVTAVAWGRGPPSSTPCGGIRRARKSRADPRPLNCYSASKITYGFCCSLFRIQKFAAAVQGVVAAYRACYHSARASILGTLLSADSSSSSSS